MRELSEGEGDELIIRRGERRGDYQKWRETRGLSEGRKTRGLSEGEETRGLSEGGKERSSVNASDELIGALHSSHEVKLYGLTDVIATLQQTA